MNEKINLAAKLALLEKPYEPGIVGFINDYKLQVVKVKGPFVWHKHEDTDDFFLVLSPDPPNRWVGGLRSLARSVAGVLAGDGGRRTVVEARWCGSGGLCAAVVARRWSRPAGGSGCLSSERSLLGVRRRGARGSGLAR